MGESDHGTPSLPARKSNSVDIKRDSSRPAPTPKRMFCTKPTKDVTTSFRTFAAADAKGGCELDVKKIAFLAIEFQNEFTTEGGKLYPAVKDVMASTDMLSKAAKAAETVRAAGGTVMHAPIMFKADASDNPNKALGILAGCAKDSLFTENTWNTEFCDAMKPAEGDVVIKGKKGLDAFPNTTLESELLACGAETIVLCGFLTNCCVESTMRTACEKGFNVVTLTDCCATTSEDGHKAAVTGTFGMFSEPMTGEEFMEKLSPPAVAQTPAQSDSVE